MSDIHVKGLDELSKFFDTLPAKIEKNIMRGALRAGMAPMQKESQALLASHGEIKTGALSKGLKLYTAAKGGKVTCSLRVTGKHAYVAHWLEFTGARPHSITGKNRKWLSFGGLFFQSVEHPGFAAEPFLRPALDSKAESAVIAVGNYVKNRLTKQGIDVADITVEGDE